MFGMAGSLVASKNVGVQSLIGPPKIADES